MIVRRDEKVRLISRVPLFAECSQAELARIDLSDDELDHLAPQLSVILESVASITGVAGDDVPPTSHAIPLTNVFREDVVVPGLSAEEALSGAPAVEEQRFSVPRILEEEA